VERELTCREFIDFLDDYLTGDQPAKVRAEFERHLSICPVCVDYLKTYRAAVRLAAASGEQEIPADAPEELIQAILAARRKGTS
jgi:anti-sigma factor RsiW